MYFVMTHKVYGR